MACPRAEQVANRDRGVVANIEAIREAGFRTAQGSRYADPMPAAEMATWLAERKAVGRREVTPASTSTVFARDPLREFPPSLPADRWQRPQRVSRHR